jgi:tagatose 6-phosphate kinase
MTLLQRILCIGTTPAIQRVMVFNSITSNAVNRAIQTLEGTAGKSVNVAKVLKTLGEAPLAVGFLGGARGEAVQADMHRRGIEAEFIQVPAPTRECVTLLDLHAQTQTELVEESAPVEAPLFAQLLQSIQKWAPHSRAVVMSGTVAPGGPRDFYPICVRIANAAGALSALDAQGIALMESLPLKPGLVKPNRVELAATVGRVLNDETEVRKAMRDLGELGAQRVVVTAGHEPVLAFDGQKYWRITPPEIKARNPIGSGDAFTAALVSRLAQGNDLGEASRWGAAAGAANALTLLPGELDFDVLKALLPQITVDLLPS